MEKLSKENLKYLVKLEQKKYRDKYNQYLIYGQHLIDEAIKNDKLKYAITIDQNLYDENKDFIEIFLISKQEIQKFKALNTIPNIIGVCNKVKGELKSSKIIGLNKIQNPGNLGTILRTAKSFGINDIILDYQSVDLYNPKTIQSMQGVHFNMNIVQTDLYTFCENTNLNIITTFLDEKSDITENQKENIKNNSILIFGNEAQGIEQQFKKLDHYNYKLPIKYESLNVAIACGIIIYEMSKE